MSSKRICILCLMLAVRVVAVRAENPPPDVPIKVNPSVLKLPNGKLPSSLNLAVYADPCDAATPDLTSYTISLMGGFLTPTTQRGGKCTVIASVTVDPNTPAGDYGVVLLNNNTPRGHATLSIADAAAGPTPPGLPPQVDVMWEVMGFKNCSDAFGKRVAQAMYCIQVKIGNNSGYPLQIAGVGFSRKLNALTALGSPLVTIANSSYASTRAVLVHAQAITRRNVAFDILQASGLILGATAPFFNRQNPKKNLLALSTIVNGPLQQAFNLIFPDPVVRQLGSLDDQSFRDNMVISNNAQMQTVAFVEKQALTQSLEELQMQLNKAEPNLSQKGALKADERVRLGPLIDTRNEIAATVRQSRRPIRTLWRGMESPFVVKLALGEMVIVGNEIAYLQRVQVVSSASPTGVGVTISPQTPSVTVASPQKFTATVTGTSTTSVTWSVKCAATGSGACGTIDPASGLYTAPATPPSPNSVTLTATSVADTTKSASTTVTITPPPLVPSNSSLDFGTQSSATTRDLTFTGTSATAGTVIGPAAIDGTNKGDFVVANNGCTGAVATGSSPCTVSITFIPPAGHGATENATLTLKDNSGNVLGLVALTGTVK